MPTKRELLRELSKLLNISKNGRDEKAIEILDFVFSIRAFTLDDLLSKGPRSTIYFYLKKLKDAHLVEKRGDMYFVKDPSEDLRRECLMRCERVRELFQKAIAISKE